MLFRLVGVIVGAIAFSWAGFSTAKASTVAVTVAEIVLATNPVIVGEELVLTIKVNVPAGMTWSPTGSVAAYCPTTSYDPPDCLAGRLTAEVDGSLEEPFDPGQHSINFFADAPLEPSHLLLTEIFISNSQPGAGLEYQRGSSVAVLWPGTWIAGAPDLAEGDTQVVAAPAPEPEPEPTPAPEPEPTPAPSPSPSPDSSPTPAPAPASTPTSTPAPPPAPVEVAPTQPTVEKLDPPAAVESASPATSVQATSWSAPLTLSAAKGFTQKKQFLTSRQPGDWLAAELSGTHFSLQFLRGPQQGRFGVYLNSQRLAIIKAQSRVQTNRLVTRRWPLAPSITNRLSIKVLRNQPTNMTSVSIAEIKSLS